MAATDNQSRRFAESPELRERVLDKARDDLGMTTWPQIEARAAQYLDFILGQTARSCALGCALHRPAPPLPPVPIDVRLGPTNLAAQTFRAETSGRS